MRELLKLSIGQDAAFTKQDGGLLTTGIEGKLSLIGCFIGLIDFNFNADEDENDRMFFVLISISLELNQPMGISSFFSDWSVSFIFTPLPVPHAINRFLQTFCYLSSVLCSGVSNNLGM